MRPLQRLHLTGLMRGHGDPSGGMDADGIVTQTVTWRTPGPL